MCWLRISNKIINCDKFNKTYTLLEEMSIFNAYIQMNDQFVNIIYSVDKRLAW